MPLAELLLIAMQRIDDSAVDAHDHAYKGESWPAKRPACEVTDCANGTAPRGALVMLLLFVKRLRQVQVEG